MFVNRTLYIATALYFVCWVLGCALGLVWDLQIHTTYQANTSSETADYFLTIFSHPLYNILANNILYGIFIFIGSAASFGFVPAVSFVYNGFILGLIVKYAYITRVAIGAIAFNLLHSPIEILAFCMLGALGIISIKAIKLTFKNKSSFKIGKEFLWIFILSFVLIIIAAIIEYLSFEKS